MKRLVRDWLPPALFRQVRRVYGGGIRFEGDFPSWEAAAARCTGYVSEEILAKVLDATLKIKRGESAFERDSVLFDDIEYAWPILAGLMWVAARNSGSLNVLDFGGALGSSYFQNRKFLQSLHKVRWNVVEQPHFVAAGQKHVQDEQLRFYKTIEECLTENQPNVILLSGVLQYLPKPFDILEKLAAIKADTLLIDRTSYSPTARHLIKLQHVPENIYKATYPCHVFNEDRICQVVMDRGYQLTEKFGSLDEFDPDTYWRGHIFSKL